MSSTASVPVGLLTGVVERALRAPSVHNTQPWRWRIRRDAVELHADLGRHLPGTDPDRRDLVISCGAALHHLQVALAATGRSAHVVRLPDAENAHHLATAEVRPGPPPRGSADLARAIEDRRTDRRRFASEPVTPSELTALMRRVAGHGVVVHPVTDPAARRRLDGILADAAARQRHSPGYAAELAIWTHRYAGARDGVPLDALPKAGAQTPGAGLRTFPPGRLCLSGASLGADHDGSLLLVLTTVEDTVLDHLLAGEATSAVLLAATRMGLATTPLSQALEVPAARARVASDVLHSPDHPQLIVRVGRPAPGAGDLPPTPRRTLESVLLHS